MSTNRGTEDSNPQRDPEKISLSALEGILNWDRPSTFEEVYRKSYALDLKYRFADALIRDGRYKNPQSLVRNFLPSSTLVNRLSPEKRASLERDIQMHGLDRRDNLRLLLAEMVDIKPGSPEDLDAQEAIGRMIEKDDALRNLVSLVPIHVVGAILSARLFDHVPDKTKREKLRSWTTRALLRPYLGDLLVDVPKGGLDFRQITELVPDRIFEDPESATFNIIRNHVANLALELFTEDETQGFQKLIEAVESETNSARKAFLESILEDFETVMNTQIPPVFKESVEGWFSQSSPFPLFRQKYFVHEFLKTKRKLLHGDTGATKTACAYLAMETSGAKKVTIFGPAKARATWPKEAKKLFRNDSQPDVFTIRSIKDLESPRMETANYVYIGSELMGKAWNDAALFAAIKKGVVTKRKTDAFILDESDEFRHESTGGAKTLVDIVKLITDENPKTPILALTGTPISSSLEDLDITMALLYPNRFGLPNRKQKEGNLTFSNQALKDPKIAFSLLFGEELMIQWTLQNIFGEKAPRLEYQKIEIPSSDYQNVIYEFVSDIPMGALAKVRMLRSVLMNPELIKKVFKERGFIPEPVYDPGKLGERLKELHSSWKKWWEEKDPRIPDIPFSADWIAQAGDRDFLIQLFFDERFTEGVESLARQNPEILKDWQVQEAVSQKYARLRHFLEERIKQVDGTYQATEKIFIVSPYHKRGITRWIDDPNTKDEDLADNAWSLYEYIRNDWFPDLPEGFSINIDGTRTFESREREAQYWRERGSRNVIVVASMGSVYESMDWAIRDTEDNKNIQALNVIYLGWPWGWDEFKQMSGRFLRPGQTKPVKIFVYEGENSIDQGFRDLVQIKFLLSQMTLAGIELSREEQAFFHGSTSSRRILVDQPRVGQVFLQDSLRRVRGIGEEAVETEFGKERDGKLISQHLAESYFDDGNDEFRIVGNNAELIKNVILRSNPRTILSVGAGSCLLARKITSSGYPAQISNLDINGSALRLAREAFPQIGQTINEKASKMSASDASYDAVDCSFMLPWTKLYEGGEIPEDHQKIERVKILQEINRVLKPGGTAVFSFPESAFDEQRFIAFTQALTNNFGFSVQEPSGIATAVDLNPTKKIGWIISLQKRGNVDLTDFDPITLAFTYDEETRISKYKETQRQDRVIRIEHPIFSAKEFEVYNPLTRLSSRTNSYLSQMSQTLSREDVVEYKRTLPLDLKGLWDSTRRYIQDNLSKSFEDAEEVVCRIFLQTSFTGKNEDTARRAISSYATRYVKLLNTGSIAAN